MANQAAVEKRPRLGKEEKEEEERWKWQRQGRLYGKHDSQEWPNNFILEAWNSKSRGDQNGKTKMSVVSKLYSFYNSAHWFLILFKVLKHWIVRIQNLKKKKKIQKENLHFQSKNLDRAHISYMKLTLIHM